MHLVLIAFAVVALAGCGYDSQPSLATPTPTPTPPAPAPTSRVYDSLSGKVITNAGICIEGAKVKVITGQRVGEETIQQTPCDAWSYGSDEGFEFAELAPEGEMTLRASANGYHSKEVTVAPQTARGQVDIELTSAQ